MRRWTGLVILLLIGTVAAGAGAIATNDPAAQFPDTVFAPPMGPHVVDARGGWRAPFVYPLLLEDRLARRFAVDRAHPVPIAWLQAGTLATTPGVRWFPLGTDGLGRDVFARMVLGARLSLGVAGAAALLTLILGAGLGGIAGTSPAVLDALLMKGADFVLALPAIYVALTLRAVLPLVMTDTRVFWSMALVLAAVAWPIVARGVRAIVARENRMEYAEAARACGAGRTRLLVRHLLPAAAGFLAVQATLLVPAFIMAEATLSYVGLGFTSAVSSWGLMLRDAGDAGALSESPWLLAPAVAIGVTVMGINLAGSRGSAEGETRGPLK